MGVLAGPSSQNLMTHQGIRFLQPPSYVHSQFLSPASLSMSLAPSSTCWLPRGPDPRPFPAASTQTTGRPLSLLPGTPDPRKGQDLMFLCYIPDRTLAGETGRPPRWFGLLGTARPLPSHPTLPSHHLSSFLPLSCQKESWPKSSQPLLPPPPRSPPPLPPGRALNTPLTLSFPFPVPEKYPAGSEILEKF